MTNGYLPYNRLFWLSLVPLERALNECELESLAPAKRQRRNLYACHSQVAIRGLFGLGPIPTVTTFQIYELNPLRPKYLDHRIFVRPSSYMSAFV